MPLTKLMHPRPLIVIVLATSLASAQGSAALLPSQDTTLYEDPSGMLANGGGSSIFVGRAGNTSGGARRRALVQFDLSAIPAGARIITAHLELFVEHTSATTQTTAFAHRVTAAWLEGTVVAPGNGGAGGAATTGETTWLFRDFPAVPWSTPGGDFDPTPSFSFDLETSGTVQSPSATGLIADVEGWLANPAGNFGWLLKTAELQASTARRCSSREAAAMQPMLRLTYLMPGQTGLVGQRCPVGGSSTQLFSLGIGVGPATGGTTIPILYVTGPANALGASYFSLGVDPVGVQLFAGCSVYLPLPAVPGTTFLTDSSGFAAAGFTVPLNAPGFLVAVQGAALDTTAAGFTLSNGGVILTQ